MNLILTKIHYMYDMELVDPNLDWEGKSHMHVMWWKPELRVRILPRNDKSGNKRHNDLPRVSKG